MAEITEIDKAGIDLIVKFENCILHPYRDQVGIPTIGVGMTYYPGGRKVTMQDKPYPTVAAAYADFTKIIQPVAHFVASVTRDDLLQREFDALISFAYNVGNGGFKGSTVHRLVNNHVSGQELLNAFLMWNKADGHILSDLTKRRKLEYQFYMGI